MSRASTLAKAIGADGAIAVSGNTTLGDASSDTVTINAATASIPNGINFANGNFGIGAASPSDRLDVRFASGTGTVKFGVTSSNNVKIYNTAGDIRLLSSDASSDVLLDSQRNVIFNTGNSERARINSGGELLVGTTSNIGVGAKVALSSSGNVLHIQSSNSGSNNLVSYDSGGTATFYVANGGSVVTTSTTRSGEGYLSPLFYQNTGVGYLDLSQGDIYNIKDVSSPGNLNAMFNGQFSPYTQSDESMSWQKFRVIFRCTRSSPTYDTPTVTFRCVNHFYASGWTESGSSFDFNGTDGERGYRWVVSPWYDYSNLGGGFDVPGWGIKLKTSSITVRVGSVFIQYRR